MAGNGYLKRTCCILLMLIFAAAFAAVSLAAPRMGEAVRGNSLTFTEIIISLILSAAAGGLTVSTVKKTYAMTDPGSTAPGVSASYKSQSSYKSGGMTRGRLIGTVAAAAAVGAAAHAAGRGRMAPGGMAGRRPPGAGGPGLPPGGPGRRPPGGMGGRPPMGGPGRRR